MADNIPVTVKTIDMAFEGHLLPPAPGLCQACAVDHDPRQPHNQQSMYYQFSFYRDNFRHPKWSDAMSHCTPEMQEAWITELKKLGVPDQDIYAVDIA